MHPEKINNSPLVGVKQLQTSNLVPRLTEQLEVRLFGNPLIWIF